MSQANNRADTMCKATDRANELYPNDRTFCGGVAAIAREAFIRGWEEALASVRVTISGKDLIGKEVRHEHLY